MNQHSRRDALKIGVVSILSASGVQAEVDVVPLEPESLIVLRYDPTFFAESINQAAVGIAKVTGKNVVVLPHGTTLETIHCELLGSVEAQRPLVCRNWKTFES